MSKMIVVGYHADLFEDVSFEVKDGNTTRTVEGYRCRWCRWTCINSNPAKTPDHECRYQDATGDTPLAGSSTISSR